jgi:hypothetical protein
MRLRGLAYKQLLNPLAKSEAAKSEAAKPRRRSRAGTIDLESAASLCVKFDSLYQSIGVWLNQ